MQKGLIGGQGGFRLSSHRHFLGGVLCTTLALIAPAARAADGKEVLRKMEALYMGAKGFQGTIVLKQNTPATKAGSGTITQTIKYKAPNLFRVQSVATGTGAMAEKAASFGQTIVSDGKSIYIYSAAQKQYMKQSAPPALSLDKLLNRVLPKGLEEGATLLPDTNYQGRSAFLVQLQPPKPNLPPETTPEQKKKLEEALKKMKPPLFTIDKENYRVLKVSLSGGLVEFEFSQQSFEAPTDATAFKFTPPAGAKEMTAPTGGGLAPPPAPGGNKKPAPAKKP